MENMHAVAARFAKNSIECIIVDIRTDIGYLTVQNAENID